MERLGVIICLRLHQSKCQFLRECLLRTIRFANQNIASRYKLQVFCTDDILMTRQRILSKRNKIVGASYPLFKDSLTNYVNITQVSFRVQLSDLSLRST